MSLYWFTRWLCHEIKESTFKIFIWKTTESEKKYGYHINPYLIGWIGFFISLNYFINGIFYHLVLGISLIVLAYFLRLYWKGEWRTYKKRMEGIE